jgi:bifunctional DNase/RNase
MIAVKVEQLFLSNLGFVVVLKGREDPRSLPIFIGAAEAQSIAIQVNDVEVPRPLTHDLVKNLLDFLECRLKRVDINDLRDGTFFASLVLERDGLESEMDCRPSDAVALALRAHAPIFVAEAVMDEAGREGEIAGAGAAGETVEGETPPPRLTPLQALEKKLEEAVRAERYEEAARLRDEINRLKGSHGHN